MALYNVNARIKLEYGERYGLTLYSLPNVGTQVEIALPLREGMHENEVIRLDHVQVHEPTPFFWM